MLQADPVTKKPDFLTFYKDMHYTTKQGWITPLAEQNYEKIVEMTNQPIEEESTPKTIEEVRTAVLGERPGYTPGLGYGVVRKTRGVRVATTAAVTAATFGQMEDLRNRAENAENELHQMREEHQQLKEQQITHQQQVDLIMTQMRQSTGPWRKQSHQYHEEDETKSNDICFLQHDQNQSTLTPKLKKSCNYTVTVETTCLKGADTTNHISLRFGDTSSNDVLVGHLNSKHMRQVDPLQPAGIDDVPKKPFQACTVDEFQVTGPCVESPVCYLYLKSRGGDDWRPGFAQVRVSQASHFSSEYFYFRRYLPRHVWHGSDECDTEVSPFGIKRKRKVFAKNMV